MKLVHYNRRTVLDPTKTPMLTLGKTITLNTALVKLMELEAGNGIQFDQDEDTGEWYISINDKDGYILKSEGEHSYCRTNAMITAKAIGETYEVELPLKFEIEKVEIKKETFFKLIPTWDDDDIEEEQP